MTGPLYVETTGEGPDLVMLHGWGMHSGVWQTVAEELSNSFRLHCVDLPGHGRSRDSKAATTLTAWTKCVAETMLPRVAGPAYWCGWSLGGMVATQLARDYSKLVKRLILVATSLRFCQSKDWLDAVAPEVLQGFATNLQVVALDTGEVTTVSEGTGWVGWSRWSSDGQALLFTRGELSLRAGLPFADLWTYNLNTAQLGSLATAQGFEGMGTWSP